MDKMMENEAVTWVLWRGLHGLGLLSLPIDDCPLRMIALWTVSITRKGCGGSTYEAGCHRNVSLVGHRECTAERALWVKPLISASTLSVP